MYGLNLALGRLNVNWKDVAAFGYTTPNFIQKGECSIYDSFPQTLRGHP